jgi:NAD(P)-dependent dehydrogenase (short-subunit alcohol dehydrogenase family)
VSTSVRRCKIQMLSRVRNAQFIKCDILSWDDQVSMFEAARNNSPHKSVDIVIANAGIGRGTGDSLFKLDGKCL